MRKINLTSLLAVGILAGGCSSTDDLLPPVDGQFAAVVVYGQVRDPEGAPVTRVSIAVTDVRTGPCAPSTSTRSEAAITDASGGYRVIVGNRGADYTTCIHVQATPPRTASLTAQSVTRSPVTLQTARLDSVRIDLDLARAP